MENKMRALPMQPLYEGNIGSAFCIMNRQLFTKAV